MKDSQNTTADSLPPIDRPPGGVGLLAIDLDGTLLRTDKRLSRRVAASVAQATRQGVHVVIASARPPRSVRAIYDKLKLTTYQVNYNGALIHDPPKRRNLFHQPLDTELARRIARLARRVDPDCLVSIEILDKWYTDRVDELLETETSRTMNPDFIGPLDAFFTVPVTKLMLLAPPDRLGRVTEQVKRKFGREVAILFSDDHLIQIVHHRVDKGVAVKWVADAYNIPAQRVVAIGDAPNDTGMLRWAGLGIAVDNAWPAVRRAADVVVPSNDADGVVHAIERYVLE